MAKRKRTIAEPLPLRGIKKIRKIDTGYGDVFEMIDTFRDIMIQSGMTWDSSCYLPLTAYVELSSKLNLHTKGMDVECLFHLAAWRRYSQIYTFDPTLVEELTLSECDDVEIESLRNLPYDSFYVDLHDYSVSCEGFFCSRNVQILDKGENVSTVSTEFLNSLHIMFVMKNGNVLGFPISMTPGLTIKESREGYTKLFREAVFSQKDRLKPDEAEAYIAEVDTHVGMHLNTAVQILLYLCAINSDVVENPEQKKIYKKANVHKDKLSSIQKWDVGYRIGQIIRQNSSTEHSSGSRTITKHSRKRPHTRRAHFHHYWTGKRDTPERKLVVKWVAPMFINTKSDEDAPAVVNIIES